MFGNGQDKRSVVYFCGYKPNFKVEMIDKNIKRDL
jgi:hypothetical protein